MHTAVHRFKLAGNPHLKHLRQKDCCPVCLRVLQKLFLYQTDNRFFQRRAMHRHIDERRKHLRAVFVFPNLTNQAAVSAQLQIWSFQALRKFGPQKHQPVKQHTHLPVLFAGKNRERHFFFKCAVRPDMI